MRFLTAQDARGPLPIPPASAGPPTHTPVSVEGHTRPLSRPDQASHGASPPDAGSHLPAHPQWALTSVHTQPAHSLGAGIFLKINLQQCENAYTQVYSS